MDKRARPLGGGVRNLANKDLRAWIDEIEAAGELLSHEEVWDGLDTPIRD